MMELNKQHPLYQEDLRHILSTPGINSLCGKSILITGASGLIGVCMIDALMQFNQLGGDIILYAVGRDKKKAAGRLGEYYEDEHFHFIEQDVRNPLPSGMKLDYIIPLASNTHPLAYSHFPVETIEINVKGAEFSLQKACECGAGILYPSSVEIYGNARGNDEFDEEYTGNLNLSNARSCYTESKRVCEALCQAYFAEKGVKGKIARLSRVFGPTMLTSDSKASSQFITKALLKEDIVLKSKGDQFYSYTYVADAVTAMLYILIHGENGVAYNISNPRCDVYLKDFAQQCADLAGTKVVYDLPSEMEKAGFSVARQAVLNSQRIQALGWQGFYSFAAAIKRTIDILS